jgi:hypothetical protein
MVAEVVTVGATEGLKRFKHPRSGERSYLLGEVFRSDGCLNCANSDGNRGDSDSGNSRFDAYLTFTICN